MVSSPGPTGSHQYRFRVPVADATVTAWIKAQDNVSFSLRALIHQHVASHGYTDATCTPIALVASPGVPASAASVEPASLGPASTSSDAKRGSGMERKKESPRPAEPVPTPAPEPVAQPAPEPTPLTPTPSQAATSALEDINSLLDD